MVGVVVVGGVVVAAVAGVVVAGVVLLVLSTLGIGLRKLPSPPSPPGGGSISIPDRDPPIDPPIDPPRDPAEEERERRGWPGKV